ncbi:7374_t:CDS:2 [Entrophospora sp. SA101]|nr:7374_t:CDS:2 [Entrophospora sp. SA101]
MIFMRISYKQQSVDPATKNIEKTILALNNEISKMRTESEWKNETQSLGRASITSHRSEYPDETESTWMPSKKSDKDDSAKSSKKKTVPSRLAKEDITAIVFAEQLKAGIKKVNAHYHIGSTTIKKIWASSNPYEHANSIGEPNLPEWYNKNVKFKESETSPNTSQEIALPEETKLLVKGPNIVKQDTSEKRKKKEAEMERIAKRIIRSELGNDLQHGHYFPDDYNYCKKDRTQLEKYREFMSKYNPFRFRLYRRGFGYKALIMVAKSYPNLKYLNLRDNKLITDKGLSTIAQLCYKLEYLNISFCKSITDESLIKIAESCQNLEEFYFSEARWITDKSISCVINQCPKLRCLDIAFSRGKIEDTSLLTRRSLSMEYLDFSGVMAYLNDDFIVAIIRSSPNLKHFDISEYCDWPDSETDSSNSDPEDEPPPLIRGSISPDFFITELNNYLRQASISSLPHFHNS